MRRKICTSVGEDDIGDCLKGLGEIRLDRRIDRPTPRPLNPNANHSDHDSRDDGNETRNRHIAHLFQRPRQREDKTHNHTHEAEHNGASTVRSDCIHHDGESEEMAAHGEGQEKDLGGAEDFSPDPSGHDFARIGHVMDMRVGEFELTEYEAGISCDDAKTCDENHTAGGEVKSSALVALERRNSRYEADGGKDGGKREDPEGDGLGDHDCRHVVRI